MCLLHALLLLFLSTSAVAVKSAKKTGCPTSEAAQKRLDKGWLDLSCERKNNWTTTAILGVNKQLDDILSPLQLKFLKDIQACDAVCLCKAFPVCKDFLDQVTHTFDNINTGFNSLRNTSIINQYALNDLLTSPEKIKSILQPNANGLTNIFNPIGLQNLLANNPLTDVLNPAKNGLSDVLNPTNLGNVLKSNGQNIFGALFGKLGRRKRRQSAPDPAKQLAVKPVVRKEYRMLTSEEREKFHSALNTLKFTQVDGMSKYNLLTVYHSAEYSPEAHFGAAFLPFHRELLKQLETALRLQDITIALPYWDSSLDEGLPAPADSILWSDEFLGNGQGDVTTGPFGNWTVQPNTQFDLTEPGHKIVRAVGQSPFGSLMRPEDRATLLSRTSFQQLVYCTDPFFELLHGAQHMWIGGHMAELTISPNDPVFHLHHNNVDRLWEDWRQLKQTRNTRESEYVVDKDSCNNFARANDTMKPFTLRNRDGLANNYTDLYYSFQPSPTCTKAKPDCGSSYLFCDTKNSRCLSKVVPKGNCKGFEGTDICYRSKCVKGSCIPTIEAKTTTLSTTTVTTPTTTTTAKSTVTATTTTTKIPNLTKQPTKTTTKSTTKPPTPTLKPLPKTVWVPITVLQLLDGKTVKSPASTIEIVDLETAEILKGEILDREDFPYYTGVAFAQVVNPRLKPNGRSLAAVSVKDSLGHTCGAQCYLGVDEHDYESCNGSIELDFGSSKNSQNHIGVSSSNITFTDKRETVMYLNWKGPVRKATSLLFICNTFNETEKNNRSSTVDSVIAETSNKTTEDTTDSSKDETCTDEHRCCKYWGSEGECKRNPVWMASSCQKSCDGCKPSKDTKKCRDYFVDCVSWSKNGECVKNPIWMEENCQLSCKTCNRSLSDLSDICGAPKLNDCVNTNAKCPEWAKKGQCEQNSWWMGKNCPLACAKCVAKV